MKRRALNGLSIFGIGHSEKFNQDNKIARAAAELEGQSTPKEVRTTSPAPKLIYGNRSFYGKRAWIKIKNKRRIIKASKKSNR